MARRIDELLAEYGESHQNPTNKAVHWVCVPVIVWTVLVGLHSLPFPAALGFVPGLDWMMVVLTLALVYYIRLSPALALGVAAYAAISLWLIHVYEAHVGLPIWQFAAGLFVLAWATSGINGWFYTGNYGVPWFDKQPVLAGHPVTSMFLVAAIVTGLLAGWLHFRIDYAGHTEVKNTRRNRVLASTPLLIVASIMVVLEVGSMAKGFAQRYPTYTVGKANVAALRAGLSDASCGMADDVLVEPDANAGTLQPVPGQTFGRYGPLGGENPVGFTPNGVSDDLTPPHPVVGNPGTPNSDASPDKPNVGIAFAAGTGGDLQKGVVLVGLAREHRFELQPVDLLLHPAEIALDLVQRGLVTLLLGQLREPHRIGEPLLECPLPVDGSRQPIALAHDRLCLLGVVPKLGILRQGAQLIQSWQCFIPVKDASAAKQGRL